jgi:hypothetical protein
MIAIALIAMSGAVVDFTSMQQSRTRAQVALDAAALALQPSIYTESTGTIQADAQALLVNRLADAVTTWSSDCSANVTPCATVATPVVDKINGQLTLDATIRVPMNFVSLVGVPTLTAQIVSVATRKKLSLEVAMVLDNSGSMSTTMTGGNSRMWNLQQSANCATNILFYEGVTACSDSTTGKTQNPDVKMAVVPFTSAVNVGTNNANASWIDRSGTGNISDDNFDNDDNDATPFTGPVDRIGLFSQMKDRYGSPLSWGGCVEARYDNGSTKRYDTDDTTPDPSQPDTLFTPYFAPDEPGNPNSAGSSTTSQGDRFYNSYLYDDPAACKPVIGNCTAVQTTPNALTKVDKTVVTETTVTQTRRSNGQVISGPTTTTTTTTSSSTTSTVPTPASTTTTTLVKPDGTTTSGPAVCTCTYDTTTTTNTSVAGSTTTSTSVSGPTTTTSGWSTITTTTVKTTTTTKTTPLTAVATSTCTQHYYAQNLSNRELQERMCKYNGAQLSYSVSQGNVYGPNGDCPFNPITPLTATPATIKAAVAAMSPQGATNIAEGAAWGFRVLSPTPPFTEGDAYRTATSKIMIVMTDGENTRYPASNMNDAQYYSPYGYPWNATVDGTTSGAQKRLVAPSTSASVLQGYVNDRLSATCTNAKAAGITVYTIGLATSDTSDPVGNKTLLTNCASEADYAFFPESASDLQDAFVAIAGQLAALRLAK